jgi:AraC-like DNA-binding protein
MVQTFTIQAKATEKIIAFSQRYEVNPDSLYHAVGLNPTLLRDPDNRIPFYQLVDLYEKAAQLTKDANFGLHLGETVNPRAFDLVGYIALNSPTLGEALARLTRYHSIWTDGAAFSSDFAQPVASLVYKYVDHSIKNHRHDSEMTFAAVTSLCRNLIAEDWTPVAVEFQHPRPNDVSEHQRLFRCPVEFGKRVNNLLFAGSSLSLPVVKADPGLCTVLDRHAEEMLAKFPPRDSLVDQVRQIIGRELNGGDPSLERIADQLGLSARTLQRKLHEFGTSHNDLLDELRHELAVRYLREPQMAICEVAYLLGFSEPSSFHRAFKRWTGKTPSELRAR